MQIRNFLPLTVLFIACLLLPGCTSTGGGQQTTVPTTTPAPQLVTFPPPTTPETTATTATVPATTLKTTTTVDPDAAFNAATEKCLNETPVVGNLTTEIALTACFQKTPRPASVCARAYRENLLKFVEDDTTTAGFDRINFNVRLLRTRYYDGQRYDTTILGWVSCGNGSVVEAYEMDHR